MSETPNLDAWDWFGSRTYHHAQFDAGDLLRRKRERGLTVSVCVPTRDEAATVGPIVRAIRRELMDRLPLVDELVVVDSRSTDETVDVARAAGAEVHQDDEVLPELGPGSGKGEALWKALFLLSGDLLVFVDADIRNFHQRFVTGLLGPLLTEEGVHYVKAFYERPLQETRALLPTGGGRVTELVVRPILNLFFPAMAGVVQPLSGEYAGTREALSQVPFATGYGVEIGLLLDVVERFGLDALAQVDLEERVHRNRTTPELARMSFGVLQAVFRRLHGQGLIDLRAPLSHHLYQFSNRLREYHMQLSEIEVVDRPPAASLEAYRLAGTGLRP